MSITGEMNLRIASIIPAQNAGGVGPVCRYAAEGMARLTGGSVTLVGLHDASESTGRQPSGLDIVGLGLPADCSRQFIDWLSQNPQDVLITSDVAHIEPAFPFFPPHTRHIVQIHDSGRRYRAVASRNARWIDGVICVASHFESQVRQELEQAGYRGLLQAIHNGAAFPPPPIRKPHLGPLRLLFMGSLDPMKGVSDIVPILRSLRRRKIPAILTIVGGYSAEIAHALTRERLTSSVHWAGRVPHVECYQFAAANDVFLMPSRRESFGMVTIEAMAMGCVPLAYDVRSGSTEIIEANVSGLLLPLGRIHSWADRLQQLHQNRDMLERLSLGAMKRARTDFNADVMASNILEFVGRVSAPDNSLSVRQDGAPPISPTTSGSNPRGYQRLPPALREKLRSWAFANARIGRLIARLI